MGDAVTSRYDPRVSPFAQQIHTGHYPEPHTRGCHSGDARDNGGGELREMDVFYRLIESSIDPRENGYRYRGGKYRRAHTGG